jgi:hypothetical protein
VPSLIDLAALADRLESHPVDTPRTADFPDPNRGPLDRPAWARLAAHCHAGGRERRLLAGWPALLSATEDLRLDVDEEPFGYGDRRAGSPTPCQPGTPLKVEVMASRAAAGEQLFHPKDGPLDQAGRVRVPVRARNGRVVGWRSEGERRAG